MAFEAVTHDKHENDKYQKNLHILKLITKAALRCSGLGIAFQFHREQSNYKEGYHEIWVNRENFIAIINAFAKLDSILQDHLKNGEKNAKMTSWKIQNDIIAFLAEFFRKRIKEDIQNIMS